MKKKLIGLVLIVSIFSAGYFVFLHEPHRDYLGQDTPKATLDKFVTALHALEREKFLDSWRGSRWNNDELVNNYFELLLYVDKFHAALKAEYGPDAVERFEEIELDGNNSFSLEFPAKPELVRAALERATVTITDNTARIEFAEEDAGLCQSVAGFQFCKFRGTWFLDTKKVLGHGNTKTLYEFLGKTYKRSIEIINKDHPSMKDIKEKLLKMGLRAVFGGKDPYDD